MSGSGHSGECQRGRVPLTTLAADFGLLALFAVAVYGMLLTPASVPHSKYSDLLPFGWPLKQLLFDSLRAGDGLPFWRIDQMSGTTALLQPQSLYLFPLHFLYWVLPPLDAIGPTFFLELLVGAYGAYALGIALDVSRGARLLMATAQLTSFKLLLIVYAGWVPVLSSMCLLPWFAAALVRAGLRPSAKAAGLLAIVTALALLAGTLQPTYYTALLAAPAFLLRASSRARTSGIGAGAAGIACAAGGGLLGFGLAALLWIPILHDLPFLSRGELDYRFFLHGRILGLEHLWTLLAPEALGTPRLDSYAGVELWEDVLYFGWIPTALALLGAARGRPRSAAIYLGLASITSVVIAFDTPLLRALHQWMPGFALFRIPGRVFFVTQVLVLALSGLGADVAGRWLGRIRPSLAAPSRAVVLALLLALLLGEGAVRARQYIAMVSRASLEPPLPIAKMLDASDTQHRAIAIGGPTLAYAWTQRLGLQMVNGYEPYGYAHYRRYVGQMVTGEPTPSPASSHIELQHITRFDMIDPLSVRFVISGSPLRLPPGWRESARWPTHPGFEFYRGVVRRPLFLYERLQPRDRVFLVDTVILAKDSSTAARKADGIDLRHTAIVEGERAVANSETAGDSIESIESRPGSLRFTATVARPRLAVVSEVWHPGWRARIDDRPARILRADLALIGIELPVGESRVELRYVPPGWTIGLAVSGIAACAVLALFAVGRRRSRSEWLGSPPK